MGQFADTEAKASSVANSGPSRLLRAAPFEAYALAWFVASMTNVFTAVFTWQVPGFFPDLLRMTIHHSTAPDSQAESAPL